MPLISESCLDKLDIDPLGPQEVMEQLQFFPEVFPFLKRQEETLGRVRPLITYLVAATIWAFRDGNHSPVRKLENGFLDTVWWKLAQGEAGSELSDVLQTMEPHMWNYFLTLARAASDQENWSAEELAIAGKIYGTILLACEILFCNAQELAQLETLLKISPEA